jgi:hypothetical protein
MVFRVRVYMTVANGQLRTSSHHVTHLTFGLCARSGLQVVASFGANGAYMCGGCSRCSAKGIWWRIPPMLTLGNWQCCAVTMHIDTSLEIYIEYQLLGTGNQNSHVSLTAKLLCPIHSTDARPSGRGSGFDPG